MIHAPPFLGIVVPPAGGGGGPLPPDPVEGAVNLIQFDNPNAFPVTLGIALKYIQNAASIGSGDIESPGEDGGCNTDITFV